jgi:hypothetical protein
MMSAGPNSVANEVACTMLSDDGVVAYRLAPTPWGVLVERALRRPGKGRVVFTTLFSDDQTFERWCNADPVRFEYPLLHVNLKRDGKALFDRRT